MLHLYGIVEPQVACGATGVGGKRLMKIACGDVVAMASDHSRPFDASPSEETLWEHEDVLETLLEAGPVLPVRFGVRFANREALRAAVQPRSAELAAALSRLRDKVELSVRLLAREDGCRPVAAELEADAGPGARYLLERLEQRRDASRKLDTVRNRLAPRAVAERSHLLPRAGTLAAAAFLVEQTAVEGFRREAHGLERELDGVVLVCTGPWPPYNFVDEPLRKAV
jgi:hypothetical protein